MPSGSPGSNISLSVHYRDASDVLVDPPDPRVDIIDPDGTERITNAVPTKLVTGIYRYVYAIPVGAPLGDWVAHWTGTISGSAVSSDETFTVSSTSASGSSSSSSATVFTIRQNDRLPIISSTLTGADGALNLTGATVRFRMRLLESTTLKVDQPATIGDADDGVVSYSWQAGDTDTAGTMLAEWQVTYPDAGILTVPNDKPVVVTATPSLETLPAISPTDLATIRTAIGYETPPTDIDLSILLSVLGTPAKVSAHVLEGRLLGPRRIKLDGDIELDYGDRKPLAAAVSRLRSANGDGTSQGLLYRTDRER